MTQFYSDPTREDDTYALPDCEVFKVGRKSNEVWPLYLEDGSEAEAGWYFWFCFPGCMPDSDPSGPYATEAEAVEAAREMAND